MEFVQSETMKKVLGVAGVTTLVCGASFWVAKGAIKKVREAKEAN